MCSASEHDDTRQFHHATVMWEGGTSAPCEPSSCKALAHHGIDESEINIGTEGARRLAGALWECRLLVYLVGFWSDSLASVLISVDETENDDGLKDEVKDVVTLGSAIGSGGCETGLKGRWLVRGLIQGEALQARPTKRAGTLDADADEEWRPIGEMNDDVGCFFATLDVLGGHRLHAQPRTVLSEQLPARDAR
eukprot:1256475-Rhodomonas_salina.1